MAMGTRAVRADMFGHGLAADVDTLARVAFNTGLAAARLDPPITDPEAFYGGLIEGIQETYRGLNARASGASSRLSP